MASAAVILANGDFPRDGGAAERLLAQAPHVVACDGAAEAYRRRYGTWPEVVIGDLDSLSSRRDLSPSETHLVQVPDQDTNDLTKALDYCAARDWSEVTVVGATGRREDHTLGNVFRCLERQVRIVSDFGTFHPVCGTRTFSCLPDRGVSVFAPDPATRMTSRGLRWPLDGVTFANLFCATLNRTSGTSFTVTSDRPVYVYIAD